MALTPRIMIVDSLSTSPQESTQNLGLTLFDRVASADFYRQFPGGDAPVDVAKVLEYAREHGIACLGQPSSSFNHRRNYQVNGTNYHLGDVVTEQAAFDFGYVEPHIDTVAGRIAQIHASRPERSHDEFTALLMEEGLIQESQTAIYKYGHIDVFSNERLQEFMWGPKVIEQNNASHPITLYVYQSGKDKVMPVGVGFFVPKKNTVYEFMTYVPVR